MPDDNIIPKQDIIDLPKISEGDDLSGVSFVSETPIPPKVGQVPASPTGIKPQVEVPKTIPPITPAPSPIIIPEVKPPVTTFATPAPDTKPGVVTTPETIVSEVKPLMFASTVTAPPQIKIPVTPPPVAIFPEVKPPITTYREEVPQTPPPSPKEMEAENKAIVRPEPLKMPSDQVFEPKPKETPPPSNLRAIRTYQADVAESVKGQKTSLVQMVMSEQARKQRFADLESPRSKRNMIFIVGGFVLLLSGTLTGVFIFNKYKQIGTAPEQQVIQSSFIFTENGKNITVTGLQTEVVTKTIALEIRDAKNKLDTIENISITENAGGGEFPLTTQRLFYFLDNRMPPSLLRSLDKDFTLGVHTFNGNNPFIILKTNFYENTFAGMLEWEQYMARDLFPVFGIDKNPDSQVFIRPFEDRTLKNRDTRTLKDDDGNILLLYTFKDKQTLIITTSSSTMEEVIRRLNSSGPVSR